MSGWKAIEFSLASDSPSPPGSDTGSPDSFQIPSVSSVTSAASAWLDPDSQRLVVCNDCSKPILEGALADHRLVCKRARDVAANKARLAEGGGVNGIESRKRALSDASADESPAKKLKSDDKAKKKTSFSVKPVEVKKPPRGKGPVDVNTQCGVIVGDGKPCARSLTCKSHSMSQKREVPGRSAPFKILLAEWQIRNNPDGKMRQGVQQTLKDHSFTSKAVLGANGTLSQRLVTDAGTPMAIAPRKLKGRQMYYGEQTDSDGSMDEGMGDSEDEVEQVLAGLTASRASCQPLARPTMGGAMCVRAIKYGRFRDALFGA